MESNAGFFSDFTYPVDCYIAFGLMLVDWYIKLGIFIVLAYVHAAK